MKAKRTSEKSSEQTARRKRAAHPDFVPTFSLQALQHRLPRRFPVPQDVPSSPKRHYRSAYCYLGYDDLEHMAGDKDLDSIRDEEAYHRFVQDLRERRDKS